MAYQVGVVGASGYSGAELLRLLETHPAIEVAVAAAHGHAGEPVDELFPNLVRTDSFQEAELDDLAGLDLVFLATPTSVSLELGGQLQQAGTRVVDLSGAFRLGAASFEDWYGLEHPSPELTPAVYGLTEHHREELAGAPLVANPGCYPTAALLGLVPLAGMLEVGSAVIDGKSGTSGAGRAPAAHLHFSHVHADVVTYGTPRHRHTAEIEHWAGGAEGGVGPVSFAPHLLPMARGLLTTTYARLRQGVEPGAVRAALAGAYADEPFVRLLPEGRFPHPKATLGSNACHLGVAVDERAQRVIVTAALDNLGKGAAGQAVQNANLMLGCEEQLGLSAAGVYP